MPTVTCSRSLLFKLIGKEFTDKEFDDLCFEFGIELDDVTTEKEISSKLGQEARGDEFVDINEIVYKIEVPANRYDLLCIEGIANALGIFVGTRQNPQYKLVEPKDGRLKIIQKAPTTSTRPFVVGCVLRNFRINPSIYKSFIDLQDKLHQNIGRRRTLISIGTHDLDTLKAPFTYDARPPASVSFVALRETQTTTIAALFQQYKNTPNCPLSPYLHITEGFENHPVILDSAGVVCSVPPIVNGEHSKIRLTTKNIFIEATGTDATKLDIVLNIIIAAFSRYCEQEFTVEPVEIVNESTGTVRITPDMKTHVFKVSPDWINQSIGINITGDVMANLLNRTQLSSQYDAKLNSLSVTSPITRADVLHPCDVMEDVAIAYGFNKIVKTQPKTSTVGKQLPINKLSDLNREVIAQCGFVEVLTWALCSHDENYAKLKRDEKIPECVRVGNPKTIEFEIVRTSLLPGLLKSLASNNGLVPLPIKIFEISDISLLDSKYDVGAKNQRNLAALYCGTTSGYELVLGLVDRVFMMNNYLSQTYINDQIIAWEKKVVEQERRKKEEEKKQKPVKKDKKDKDNKGKKDESTPAEPAASPSPAHTAEDEAVQFEFNPDRIYHHVISENSTYFPGRRADIMIGNHKVGSFGILHPEVAQAFGIAYPCSAMEINLEFFMDPGTGKKIKATSKDKKL